MSKLKNFFGFIALCLFCFFVYAPVFSVQFALFNESFIVVAHLSVVLCVYLIFQKFVLRFTAFLTAVLFCVFPGFVYILAIGTRAWWMGFAYVLILALCVILGFMYERFFKFLKSQEKIVRDLLKVAVIALILGLALVSVQTVSIFKDQEGLLRLRLQFVHSAQAYNDLADYLNTHKNTAKMHEMIMLYSKAILSYPKDARAYLALAGYYRFENRFSDSLAVYRQLVHADPFNQHVYFLLAQLYQAQGKAKEAIEVFNDLIKIYPEDERVIAKIIEAYSKAIAAHPEERIYNEKREEMLASYDQLSKRKTYTAGDYYNLGFLYQQVGGNDEAIRFYRKALTLDPKFEKALFSLAQVVGQTGDVKSALILYEHLLKLNSRSSLAYLNMGIIYNAFGDTARARSLYQKVINVDPNNADAYFNLGYISETVGELREALNFYEKAVENNPKHAEAYYNMGNVYASLGQNGEAIAAYLKTIAINANHQSAFVNLSILSFKAKDFTSAIHYLDEARVLGYTPPEEYLKTLEPYKTKR